MIRFVFAILCLMSSCFAQTNFSGFVNGTVRFTKQMSPITFGSVIIQGGTLIVDPGVELIAGSTNSYISLNNGSFSTLSIQGTELEPVIIRPAGNFAWRGIYNINRSTRPRIEIVNAMVLGLGATSRTLNFASANILLVNSMFQGARTTPTGVPTFGVASSLCTGIVDNCLIDGFNTGILSERGLIIRDVDIRNTVIPTGIPQNTNVTVSLTIE